MTLPSRHRILNLNPDGLRNEMNRDLGHFCAHIGQIGPGEPPEDGEMTLPSKHRIRTLPLGHRGSPQYLVLGVDGEETFFFFQTAETGRRTPNSGVKGSGANHYPRAPAFDGLRLSSTPLGFF